MKEEPDGAAVDDEAARAETRARTLIRLDLEKLGALPTDIDTAVSKVFARIEFHRIDFGLVVGLERHPERGFVLRVANEPPYWMTHNFDLSWQIMPRKPEPIRPTPPYLRPARASRA